MRVLGYCRASTSMQVQSPDIQKQIILDHCKKQGLEVDDFYVDAATSGKINLAERKAGNKLMGALRRGDHVVVARLDRVTRSFVDFAGVIQTWANQGVIIHICDMPGGIVDPSHPISQLLVHMLAAFAQYERQLISSRTKEAAAHHAALGRKCRATPDYGFKFVKREDGHEYLEPDVQEAKVCLECLRLRRLNYSVESISQYLAYTLKIQVRANPASRKPKPSGNTRMDRKEIYVRIRNGLRIEALIKEGKWTPPPGEDMSLPAPSPGPTGRSLQLRPGLIRSPSSVTPLS